MSGKYVLIPLKTFQDLCTTTKKAGTTITGTIQNLKKLDEDKKRYKI